MPCPSHPVEYASHRPSICVVQPPLNSYSFNEITLSTFHAPDLFFTSSSAPCFSVVLACPYIAIIFVWHGCLCYISVVRGISFVGSYSCPQSCFFVPSLFQFCFCCADSFISVWRLVHWWTVIFGNALLGHWRIAKYNYPRPVWDQSCHKTAVSDPKTVTGGVIHYVIYDERRW